MTPDQRTKIKFEKLQKNEANLHIELNADLKYTVFCVLRNQLPRYGNLINVWFRAILTSVIFVKNMAEGVPERFKMTKTEAAVKLS